MGLRSKKSRLDQATDVVEGYVDSVRPHVQAALESAMESTRDFVQDTAIPALNDAKDKAGPAIADARDKAAPVVAEARVKAAAQLADAREKAAPVVAEARQRAADQLVEARAAGADLVLLIVAALDDVRLHRLHDEARELGLTVLVEVHDEPETERAVELGAELIGVNARNLKTLAVDNDTFGRLVTLLPDDRVAVAESGITDRDDVARFVGEGARAVLVGEALVKDGAPRAAVAGMTGLTGLTTGAQA